MTGDHDGSHYGCPPCDLYLRERRMTRYVMGVDHAGPVLGEPKPAPWWYWLLAVVVGFGVIAGSWALWVALHAPVDSLPP